MPSSSAHPPIAAGWYPHPDMAQTLRYWDGSEWTDKIAPVMGAVPATPTPPLVPQVTSPAPVRPPAPARYDQRWIDDATTSALLWGVFFPPAGLLKSRKVRRLASGAGDLADYTRKKANTVLIVALASWAVWIVGGVLSVAASGLIGASAYTGDEVADGLIADWNDLARINGQTTMSSADCDDIPASDPTEVANCQVTMSSGQEVQFQVMFFENGVMDWAAEDRIQ